MLEGLRRIDIETFLWLNSNHSDFQDIFFHWVSDRFVWIPFYALLLFLLWRKFGWKGLLILVPAIAILIVCADQGSVFVKNFIGRARPCHNTAIMDKVHIVNEHCGGAYGFFSSHASNAFAMASYVGLLLRRSVKWVDWPLMFYCVFITYSRIYLGVHYPADVLAGSLYGIVLGYIMFRLTSRPLGKMVAQ